MKTKEMYLKDVKQGDRVSTSFLVAEKSLAFSQKGSPYLNVRLKDKTGEVDGKVWDNAIEFDRQFKKGDIIAIEGRAANYKNSIQISIVGITKCSPADVEPTDYLPAAPGDLKAMYAEMLSFVETVSDKHLRHLLHAFFNDFQTAELFQRAPAAKGFHHVYLGGLLEHTLSVVRLLAKTAQHYPALNYDLLIAGGLLHDIGKIYEFSYDSLIEYSDEGRLIGHIVMGVEMIDKKIAGLPEFPTGLARELRHIILSHHGEFEFGSPKRPKTMEALVVHYIDDLDAKLNAFQNFLAETAGTDSEWTNYNRFFERYLYKRK